MEGVRKTSIGALMIHRGRGGVAFNDDEEMKVKGKEEKEIELQCGCVGVVTRVCLVLTLM